MLAVSKAASPYAALWPESSSSTAADTSAPDGTVTDAIAFASEALRSTAEGDVARSTDASSPAAAEEEADGDAADDTAPAPECARAFTQTVLPAVTPATATTASAVDRRGRRRARRARRRPALEDSMPGMLGAGTVCLVGRT
ncbi:hypothetical protein Scel_73160 [Streptomyces cellostaticus]|nr:hypothetical protein Scel_73160 [Streptomyces cellostaticus]